MSERDFGFVVRAEGVFHVYVDYDADGGKVKTREEPVTGEAADQLAVTAAYGDAPTDADRAEFAQLAKKHGPGGAYIRVRYPDHDDREAAYAAAVAAAGEAA